MALLRIVLQEQERLALENLADRELRDPRAQASLLIRQGLERYGLIPAENENKVQVKGGKHVHSS